MSIPARSFGECFTEHSGVPGLVLFAGNRMLWALPHGQLTINQDGVVERALGGATGDLSSNPGFAWAHL